MKLALLRSDDFNRDFDLQHRWYLEKGGERLAGAYLAAVLGTLHRLATQPDLGRRRKFRHPRLANIRSFRLSSPFGVHLIFYRHGVAELMAERLMHGARDLRRRLLELPVQD